MDIWMLLKAAILGLLEGATEFLPISSTGHLIIAQDLLDYNDEAGKVFTIAIQLGAIFAICWHYRAKIFSVLKGLPSEPGAQRFTINLMIAFIPAMVFGLLFHKLIKEYLFSPLTVAGALIVGGFIILLIERYKPAPRIHSVDDMRWSDALKVGLAQSVALFPGTSRSGATIMGGMVFGLSRTAATEFSFFLAIPTMFAAVAYDLYKNAAHLHSEDMGMIAVGFVMAFISGLAAVRFLLRYVSSHSFVGFAWYRIVFGSLVLLYFL
ncbi:MAG TPA: undecaprenyl-diphosphate phosphatase [bacterium]|nr:undecaprenyl-diphosphate phosphatase [bacterium]